MITLLVSEHASEKVERADHLSGASTYPGEKTRGGWVPILSKANDFSQPFISDWSCPTCKVLTAHSRCCPKCGLVIMEVPRAKPNEPLERGMKLYQYRKWADNLFEVDDEPRRSTGSQAKHKSHPGQRPGKTAKGHW